MSDGTLEGDPFKKLVKLRPCSVCEGPSSGNHFGVLSCEACKSFFRRSLKRKDCLLCARDGNCVIKFGEVKGTPCPACRMNRCLQAGMSMNAVKKGRYSLERRAETIIESKKLKSSQPEQHGNSSSNPSVQNTSHKRDLEDMKMNDHVAMKRERLQMETCGNAEYGRLVKEEYPSPSSRIPYNVVVEWSPPRSEGIAEALSSPSPLETEETDPKKNSIAALLGMSGQSGRRSSLSDSQVSTSTFSPKMELPCIDNISNREGSHSQMFPENRSTSMPTAPSQTPLAEKNLSQRTVEDLPSSSEQEHPICTHSLVEGNISVNSVIHIHTCEDNATSGSELSVLDEFATLLSGAGHIPQANFGNLPSKKASSSDTQECETIEELFRSVEDPSDGREMTLEEIEGENLDKLTEKTVEAYNKQNFVTRGFLAKLPALQHTYLKDKKEREKLFGSLKPLGFEDHKLLYNATGIDIDGRREVLFTCVEKIVVPESKKSAAYIANLPGMKTLPAVDKHMLLKCSHLRLLLCIHFPNANVKSKILVADVREEKDGVCKSTGHMVHDEDFLLYVFGLSKDVIDQGYVLATKLQNLALTDQEYVMVSAACLIRPKICVTNEGRTKCDMIQQKMFKALEKLLHRRLKRSEVYRILSEVHEINEMFEVIEENYFTQWKNFFIRNKDLNFPKLVWELLPSNPMADVTGESNQNL